MIFITQVKLELLKGNRVSIDGLANFGTSISAKLSTSTEDLPADSQVKVTLSPSRTMNEEVGTFASVSRITAPSLALDLLTVTAVTGSLTSLIANNTMTIEDDRLSFDNSHNDEGVFFVKVSDGTAVRASIFTQLSEKKLTFIIPSGVPTTGTAAHLEVRARRKNTLTLRTGTWPTNLNVTSSMKKAA